MKAFAAGALAALILLGSLVSVFAVYYAGTQQIVSTVTTGTSPFTVASTTKVTNLNVDFLDGEDSSAFLNNRCLPIVTSGSTSSTTPVETVICTSCAGWLQTYTVGHSDGSPRGRLIVQVDGRNSTIMDDADYINGATLSPQSQYALARFTSSVSVWAYESMATAAYTTWEIGYCEEF